MRVIRKIKKSVIQEFQYRFELQLIEVLVVKMLPIQFVSNLNLMQIESSEVVDVFSQCQTRHLADAISPHRVERN
jgi:hypothetical protein